MRLENLLEQRKATIVKKWFDMVIKTYAPDAAEFYKSQKDPFANPVGRTLFNGLKDLFGELLKGIDYEKTTSLLDPIIRIRAIQDFTPSQATAFILSLKQIIRENLNKELDDNQILKELLLFESKIDELSLIAFDIYMKCREKIYDLKANVERNKIYKAFARAGLIKDVAADEPNLKFI